MAVVNRFSQRRNYATFNPMSMQELMVVPQYRQQQHDYAEALAEAQKTEGTVLSPDKEKFAQGANEINKGITSLVDDLTEKGLQSNTLSNVRSLKKKREDFLDPTTGFGGRALANYALYQEGVKDIEEMRKTGNYLERDLTNSMMLSLSRYKGVDEGDTFNMYNPSRYVDMGKKTLEILDKVPIQEIETALGLQEIGFDPTTGNKIYQHGSTVIKERSKEHQMLVAQQFLNNDPEVQAYLNDQATFAQELHSTIEEESGSIIYGDKYYNPSTFKDQFIQGKILNIATMGAEATDVRSVKQDLDYKFVKASEAYARAWREAHMPGSKSTTTGGMDENRSLGDVNYLDDLAENPRYTLVGLDQKKEFTTTKKGKYPSGLSRKQFKEYQKQLGEKPHNTGFGVFDYERYWFEDHFPNLSDPGYEVGDQTETEELVVRNQGAETVQDFRNIWKRKTKGTEYENWPEQAVDKLYEHMTSRQGILFDSEDGLGTARPVREALGKTVTDFAPFGFGSEGDITTESVTRAIDNTAEAVTKGVSSMGGTSVGGLVSGAILRTDLTVAADSDKSMFKYHMSGKDIQNILGLQAQRMSEEDFNAHTLINNQMVRQNFEAFQVSHPNVSFEDWKELEETRLKNSGQVETILEGKQNIPSSNSTINNMLDTKSLSGLAAYDISIERFTDSRMEDIETTGGEFVNALEDIGEIESISYPLRIREDGDYTKIGGYQFNVTNKDGTIFRVKTQPLVKEEASIIAPLQRLGQAWNNLTEVQLPSTVGQDNVLRTEQMVVGEKGKNGWVGTDGAYMLDINRLMEAGFINENTISRGSVIEVDYSPFNTYGKGGDQVQNRGIKKYYITDPNGVKKPLIDPTLYDQTLMTDDYKRQQVEAGNLKQEDLVNEEGLNVLRSLMMNRGDFYQYIRQKSNLDYTLQDIYSAAIDQRKINPQQ